MSGEEEPGAADAEEGDAGEDVAIRHREGQQTEEVSSSQIVRSLVCRTNVPCVAAMGLATSQAWSL